MEGRLQGFKNNQLTKQTNKQKPDSGNTKKEKHIIWYFKVLPTVINQTKLFLFLKYAGLSCFHILLALFPSLKYIQEFYFNFILALLLPGFLHWLVSLFLFWFQIYIYIFKLTTKQWKWLLTDAILSWCATQSWAAILHFLNNQKYTTCVQQKGTLCNNLRSTPSGWNFSVLWESDLIYYNLNKIGLNLHGIKNSTLFHDV